MLTFLYSFKAGDDQMNKPQETEPPFLNRTTPWADSLIKSLSDEQKIAQLFMVAAYSNRDKEHEKELKKLIGQYGIGGLIYFQGGPLRQANMCNRLQASSDIPLMIGMDAEWGMAMRLDSTVKYPWQMTLGAIQDNQLIFEMGKQIGSQLKRMGIHINFAPVVDVNVNPDNPVINARSFGENRENVAQKGIAYMLGMQSQKVMANAKHFPGHGDTDKDSHKTLPIIHHSGKRLDSVEIYPFKSLMKNGLSSVMVAHLYVPALEDEFNLASTLSSKIVNDLLKDSLRFEGLVITDALNMKGVSSKYKPGEVDLKALLAGNDVLLFSEDVPKAIVEIQKAIKAGEISQEEIDKRCLKILRAKEWVGLNNYQAIDTANLYTDLNKPEYNLLKRKLIKSAITLLQNKNKLIPLKSLDTLKIAAIAIGDGGHKSFHRYLSMYGQVDTFSVKFDPEPITHKKIMDQLKDHDLIIASIHTSDKSPFNRFKVDGYTADFLTILRMKKKVILTSFANPYALGKMNDLDYFDGIIQAYQNNESANELSAQLIFGGLEVDGKIPVTINRNFPVGSGIKSEETIRFNYVFPEEIGLDRSWLAEIDSIAIEGLKEGAYPGCQILASHKGQIFYNRTFGYHTYDSSKQVKVGDVYDLASITKIASTLLMIMKLDEQGEIDLDYLLCDYLPDLVDSSDYANLKLRDILAHQAGLTAWIPFYKKPYQMDT
jgi:beta-N-acetylhexosaminidase